MKSDPLKTKVVKMLMVILVVTVIVAILSPISYILFKGDNYINFLIIGADVAILIASAYVIKESIIGKIAYGILAALTGAFPIIIGVLFFISILASMIK